MRTPGALTLLALAIATPAAANFCSMDQVPAATLLVPWVAVSMNGDEPDPDGYTTYLTLTNVAPEATLIEMTVWDVQGQPRLTLTEALSGYDTWSVNFKDVLSGHWGVFDTSRMADAPPNTLDGHRDPVEWGPDGRDPHYSHPPEGWPPTPVPPIPTPEKTSVLTDEGCAMPYGSSAGEVAAPLLREELRSPLCARYHGGCTGPGTWGQYVTRHLFDWLSKLGGDPVVFFVTVDVVSMCSTLTPADATYWSSAASDRNVLIGNAYYVNSAQGFSESLPAVAIEASASASASVLGFYEARFGVEDRREPLATAFAVPFQNDPPSVTSELMVWKTVSELKSDGSVLDCGG
jgi:hypothetical protein